MTLKIVARSAATPSHTTTPKLSHLQRLFASRHTEWVDVNAALYGESEPDYLFEVVSGCVRRYTIRCDGRRAIVSFAFEGDYCGHFLEGTSALIAEAVTTLTVRRISGAQLRSAITEQPSIEGELLQLARRELDSARTHLVLLGSSSAVLKVASFLLSCTERLSSRDAKKQAVSLPMRRLDIADFLGLTIESVSRSLTLLKRRGCISLRGPNEVTLQNVSALRRIANEQSSEELVPMLGRHFAMGNVHPLRMQG